jgi:hypothetical protein
LKVIEHRYPIDTQGLSLTEAQGHGVAKAQGEMRKSGSASDERTATPLWFHDFIVPAPKPRSPSDCAGWLIAIDKTKSMG